MNTVEILVKARDAGTTALLRGIGNAFKGLAAVAAGSIGIGMIAPLVGAALALGSFAAVALPTLDKVKNALTLTGTQGAAAWAKLDPAQRGIARDIQGLHTQFDGLAASMQPVVDKVLRLAVNVGQSLLPAVAGLAKAGGNVLIQFFTPLLHLLQSDFFRKFITDMSNLANKIAPTLGQSLVNLLKAFMNLFTQAGPPGAKLLDDLLKLLPQVVSNLEPAVTWTVKLTNALMDLVAHHVAIAAAIIAIGAALALAFGGWKAATLAIIAIITGLTYLWRTSQRFRDDMSTALALVGESFVNMGLIASHVLEGLALGALDAGRAIIKGLQPVDDLLGGPLKSQLAQSSKDFGKWYQDVKTQFGNFNNTLDGAKQKLMAFPTTVRLKGDITDLQSKVNAGLKLLKSPALSATQTATIRADVSQAMQQIAALRVALDAIQSKTVTVTTIAIGGGKYLRASGGIVGAATGGIRSNLTMVGEHGRELVSLPPGSMVHSNPDTERMLSSGGGDGRPLVLQVAPGGSALDELFFTWLRNGIRGRAGGGTNSVQRALGQSS